MEQLDVFHDDMAHQEWSTYGERMPTAIEDPSSSLHMGKRVIGVKHNTTCNNVSLMADFLFFGAQHREPGNSIEPTQVERGSLYHEIEILHKLKEEAHKVERMAHVAGKSAIPRYGTLDSRVTYNCLTTH